MAQLLSKTARTLRIPNQTRAFSLFPSATTRSHKNRLFDNVRQPQDLHTLTLLNAADNRSLITFWSASWCQTCQTVKPLIKQLIEEERVGEHEGGLGFVVRSLYNTGGDVKVLIKAGSRDG